MPILRVRMGETFALADEHLDLELDTVRALLRRPEHEARVLALSVLGRAVLHGDRGVLDALAASSDPLRQRSALMATLGLVRRRETADAVRLATGMLGSPAEQLQRTIGAVLREVGKVDGALLVAVLEREAPRMTAIALRFATERLEPAARARLRAARVA